MQLNHLRAHWDYYDTNVDTGLFGTDTVSESIDEVTATLNAYYGTGDAAFSDHGKNDGMACPLFGVVAHETCWITIEDAYNIWDYKFHDTNLNGDSAARTIVVQNACH